MEEKASATDQKVLENEGNLPPIDENASDCEENCRGEEEKLNALGVEGKGGKSEIIKGKSRDFSEKSDANFKVVGTEGLVRKCAVKGSSKRERGRKKKVETKSSVEEEGLENGLSNGEKAEGVGDSGEATGTMYVKSRLRTDRRKVSYAEIEEFFIFGCDGDQILEKKKRGRGRPRKETVEDQKGQENVWNEMGGGEISNLKKDRKAKRKGKEVTKDLKESIDCVGK